MLFYCQTVIEGEKLMSFSRIEELKREKQIKVKERKSQIPYGICICFGVLVVYGYFLSNNIQYSNFWIIGILMGVIMQRSRFCFAASFRDPIMVGSTSLLKAVIIGLIIATIGFSVVQYVRINGMNEYSLSQIPGQLYPAGPHTMLGAILFGIGMVIAGGCATGTMIRIGEGYMMQIVVMIGFIIGATTAASHFEFWDRLFISKSSTIYIPNYIGFFPSVILQIFFLLVLYWFAHWYGKRNSIMTIP